MTPFPSLMTPTVPPSVTFSATIGVVAPGAGVPTGTVNSHDRTFTGKSNGIMGCRTRSDPRGDLSYLITRSLSENSICILKMGGMAGVFRPQTLTISPNLSAQMLFSDRLLGLTPGETRPQWRPKRLRG